MSTYPAEGSLDWDGPLKDYIDAEDAAHQAAAQAAAAGVTDAKILAHKTAAGAHDATVVTYAGGPVLPASTAEAALDTLDQRTGLGTTVADSVNLNDLTATGLYFRGTSVGSTLALNYPEEGWSGFIKVSRSATGTGPVVQEALAIYSSNGPQTTQGTHFYRTRIGNSWNPWMRVLTTKDITPKALAATQDLNLLLEPGAYTLTAGGSTTALNWPFAGFQGHIEVLNLPARNVMVQRLTQTATLGGFPPGTQWNRALHGTVWGPWQQILAKQDTGWRDVTSLLSSDWVAASVAPICRIRRVGHEVTFQVRLSPAASKVGVARAGAHTVMNPLPSGFVSDTYQTHGVAMLNSGLAGTTSTTSLMNHLQVVMNSILTTGVWASGDVVHTAVTWTTSQAFPTTLPGTPV